MNSLWESFAWRNLAREGTMIFFAKPIVKIGSLNLLRMESTFCYREILRFWGLWLCNFLIETFGNSCLLYSIKTFWQMYSVIIFFFNLDFHARISWIFLCWDLRRFCDSVPSMIFVNSVFTATAGAQIMWNVSSFSEAATGGVT